jgi:hypothetical protein
MNHTFEVVRVGFVRLVGRGVPGTQLQADEDR